MIGSAAAFAAASLSKTRVPAFTTTPPFATPFSTTRVSFTSLMRPPSVPRRSVVMFTSVAPRAALTIVSN
jgi:hypothetical protein